MPRHKLPVDPLVETWVEFMQINKGRSYATCSKYRGYMRLLEDFLVGTPLLNVEPRQLERFVGLHLHQAGHSPQSRQVVIACVRGFYAWAHRNRHCETNPAASLDVPRAGRKLPPLMGLENAQKMLSSPDLTTFRGLRDAAILHVLLGTGCRVSGLVRLNESDLVWYRNEHGTERLAIRLREKGKKERIVPAPLEVGLILRAYLGHPYLDTLDRSIGLHGDRVLFVSTRGRRQEWDSYGERLRLCTQSIVVICQRYGKLAGIPKEYWHPHAFRHQYATELAEDGVGLHEIAALLGHARVQTTTIYTHLAYRRLAQIVDKSSPLTRIKSPMAALKEKLERAYAQK